MCSRKTIGAVMGIIYPLHRGIRIHCTDIDCCCGLLGSIQLTVRTEIQRHRRYLGDNGSVSPDQSLTRRTVRRFSINNGRGHLLKDSTGSQPKTRCFF